MKELKINIPGFTQDTTPDFKPAHAVFGLENVGKTRYACTAPHRGVAGGEGLLGFLALDKNCKLGVERHKELTNDKYIVVNKDPFLSTALAKQAALTDDPSKTKGIFKDVYQRALEAGMKLAENPDIESIAVDNTSQLFDYILFSHFGRRNQIESFMRGAPNQDLIDFVQALSSKNLVLIHRASEEWKNTGEKDKQGNAKQAPSGKFKPDGFSKIGGFVTATLELTSKRRGVGGRELEMEDKYRIVVHSCKGNTLLEGQDLFDYGVSGEAITWENVMAVLGQ